MERSNPSMRIARAPDGLPAPEDFALVDEPMPSPDEGEVLFRAIYMSLDPSMRRKLPAPEEPFGASLRPVLRGRLRIEGFVVYDHYEDQFAQFQAEMRALIAAGRMKYRIEIIDGFADAPGALARLLEGRNKGKMIVQLGPDPTA